MKRLFRIVLMFISVVAVMLICLLLFVLTKLPAPQDFAKVISSKSSLKNEKQSITSTEVKPTFNQSIGGPEEAPKTVSNSNHEQEEFNRIKRVMWGLLENDFANPDRPLVNVCNFLSNGEKSKILSDEDRTGSRFIESLIDEDVRNKDPLSETVLPAIRFVLRAPGIMDTLDILRESVSQESGVLRMTEKAKLYGSLVRAANYFHAEQNQINQILQKSYNLHFLTKAVALNPKLATDPATLDFCKQLESNLNSGDRIDVRQQILEMETFFKANLIDTNSIGFDRNYRAKIRIDLAEKKFNFEDSFMLLFFGKDLEGLSAERNRTRSEK